MDNKIIGDWHFSYAKQNSTDAGVRPCLKNITTGSYVLIPNDKLHIFGHVCNGPSLGITGIYDNKNIDQQINVCIEIISDWIFYLEKEPEWYTIRSFLKQYKGKTRLSKLVPMSKIDQQSIIRVIDIINDEYQSIVKFKKES